MSKVLRVHNSTANPQGIDTVPACVTIGDFAGVPDPLSIGSGISVNILAEKPASSIPSIFARMIFFRMAFGGIEPSKYVLQANDPISVYNRAISQCFDLLEIVFNKQRGLKIECFDFAQQIHVLMGDGNSGNPSNQKHRDFAESLKKQKDKFLRDVDCIYLFYFNNELMGGTSKYSMVFTSPNWDSGKPVRSLLERDLEFRKFVYKYARAYNRTSNWGNNADEHEFYEYIRNCFHSEEPTVQELVPDPYTIDDLKNDYPILELPVNDLNTRIFTHQYDGTRFFLYNRPQNQFISDFFIRSTIHPNVDRDHTPLVLAEGQYYGMKYYDQEMWKSSITVSQVEHDPNNPDEKNDLPDCNAYTHPYLTEIDFLEENLLALPFEINTEEFYGGISLDDDYSAMIPVKPVFFQYFTREDLNGMMEWNQKAKELVLSIPVCNVQGQPTGEVVFRKRYSESNVCYLKEKDEKDVKLSLGIFPLLKAKSPITNDYWIRFGMDSEANYQDVKLHFYNMGSETKLLYQGLERRDTASKSWHQNVKDFDYVQIELPEVDGKHQKVRAIVVPKFDAHPINNTGNHQYTYAVDFGTTNTHIAFSVDGGEAESFKDNEIKQQVAYLDKFEDANEGNLEMLQAREFIPHIGTRNNNYSFPIRTVVNSNGTVNIADRSVLFTKTSIGFRYPNEKIQNSQYHTDLKWKYLTDSTLAVNNLNVNAYFEEIMRMIKTHWLLQTVDHSQLPEIVLTYPLAGINGLGRMRTGWNDAYFTVFGVNGNIRDMAESLAPCIKKIRFAQANETTGILNIDIGGGSTDIQYYSNSLAGELSHYDSIKFAGDDLWGIGNENISEVPRAVGVTSNRFTQLADSRLGQAAIRIGGESLVYKAIQLFDCKEKVNMLLRDGNHNLANLLGDFKDSNTRVCRLHLFLHYSAIIYHVAKWMQTNQLPFPETLSLTGLGSLYVNLLFSTNAELSSFTKSLLETFYSGSTAPNEFVVQFEPNPKNVTAEGATMSMGTMQTPVHNSYCGYAGNRKVLLMDIGSVKTETLDSFNEFLDGFETCSSKAGNVVPSLINSEKTNLKGWADKSFEKIATAYKKEHKNNPQDALEESSFVWTLKDSLWKL